jgi:glyoxylase-like metal-dependent hydrolase (beta-lactamase superfamily II)
MIEKLSKHLFRFTDTCHVYIIRHERDAVLIDFGAGAVLDHLDEIGVTRVTDVLMTHHHRDQAQGLPRAIVAGARVWVPHQEQDLFARVEAHWQAREIANNYSMRQDRFSLLESIPIAGTLRDYSTPTFGATKFFIAPTPGHTTGSVTLIAEIDGARVAFIGDLMCAPGKVWSLSAMQWTYNGAEGAAATILSALDLQDRQLDLLLPSHGEAMSEPAHAIDLLIPRLRQLLSLRQEHQTLFELRAHPYVAITPHLLRLCASASNTYVLLSQTGKALFIDYGYDFVAGMAAGTDRAARRPWLYTLPTLKRDFGVTQIDVAIATHYHDDHVAGFNLLREVEGTQIWAAENFADVLQHPTQYDLPCLWYDPIPVDCVVRLAQPIRWEEYTLTCYPQPGHTLYAVAITFEVDGKRALAIGDQHQGDDATQWNYVYQNGFRIGDYRETATLYKLLAPDVILSGHWQPVWVTPDYFQTIQTRGDALECVHQDLLPVNSLDFDSAGFSARIRPYQIQARGNKPFAVAVQIKNPFTRNENARIEMVVPAGWQVEPAAITTFIAALGTSIVDFTITPPRIERRRARIAADVTIGATHLGQHAEALVTIENGKHRTTSK